MDLPSRFLELVRASQVLRPGDSVVVACSGGADSVALAHLLAAVREPLRLDALALAHLDHGLRSESSEDAAFVTDLAGTLNLPATVERRQVTPDPGESPEAAARRVRYAFLADAARLHGATAVATAHHLDDQAETVLLRAVTGTGVSGLQGIRPSRPLPGAERVRIVRPLLALRAADLRSFLRDSDLAWREDPTNVDGNLRARLRNQALPLLSRLASRDVAPLLARLAENVRADALAADANTHAAEAFVQRSSDAIRLLSGWSRLADELLAPAVRSALQALRGDPAPPSRAEVARVLGAARGNDSEPASRVTVETFRDGTALVTHEPTPSRSAPLAPQPLMIPGAVRLPGGSGTIRATTGPLDAARVVRRLRARDGSVELLDASGCRPPFEVRGVAPGDRFRPLGSTEQVRVRHFLQRHGVGARVRGVVPLVCDADGILWVAGVGIAHRARLGAATEQVLELELSRPGNS